jgi:hypothetical protein
MTSDPSYWLDFVTTTGMKKIKAPVKAHAPTDGRFTAAAQEQEASWS